MSAAGEGAGRWGGEYRCVATTVGGFVQQLAVAYLAHGYWFYVTGRVPERKDPAAIDAKLIDRYGIAISKFARARRKQAGQANLQYLRYDRFFVLLATHGKHPFFEEERESIRDARRNAIRFKGYSISHRQGHPHVRIGPETYKELKAYYVERAVHRAPEPLMAELGAIPYEPYATVRWQLLAILRAVNEQRKSAGLSPIANTCFRFTRRIYRPFERREEPPPGLRPKEEEHNPPVAG